MSDNVAKKYGHIEGITYLVGNYENNKEVCEEKFNNMMETYNLNHSFIDVYTKLELKLRELVVVQCLLLLVCI